MAKRKSNKRLRLEHLTPKQLRRVANYNKIKFPAKWGKPTMVDFLELNVSEASILKALPKAKTPADAYIKGAEFEKKAMKFFEKRKGYKCKQNIRKKIRGTIVSEFDIIGVKETKSLLSKKREWIFVECKNKANIPPTDWSKFVGNLQQFRNRKDGEKVTGWFCTTGSFHPAIQKLKRDVKDVRLKTFDIK